MTLKTISRLALTLQALASILLIVIGITGEYWLGWVGLAVGIPGLYLFVVEVRLRRRQ